HDRQPASSPVDEQRVDLVLNQVRSATVRTLPDEHTLRLRRRLRDQGRSNEAIVNDHIGRLQDLEAFRGDQAWVSRPGTDQIDDPRLAGRERTRGSALRVAPQVLAPFTGRAGPRLPP